MRRHLLKAKSQFMNLKGRNGGFTFIEMISALALMAVLSAILGMGLVAAMQSYDFSRTNVQVAQKGQMAMARVARELAQLTAVHDAADPYIIYERVQEDATGAPRATRFGLHFNPDDATLRLHTNLDPGTTSIAGSQGDILVNQAAGFSLEYFQGANPWTPLYDLRFLSTIQITLRLTRPDAPGRTQNFRTLVHMRNTGNEGGAAP